ncbi:MAG TPA: T9SS type A sorting domain-containing protein, partial [Bacteroidales bacterium]|nr:T9SS type A sorting domain-containing protein [Bacteroidales bacterium]
IFPNPSNGSFFIDAAFSESTSLILKLTDVSGRQIWVKTIASESAFSEKINCVNCKSGTYFLHLTSDKGSVTRRLVVNHGSI